MNDALKNILERNSHRSLVEPIPGGEEMELVYKAALRAPDHAWLRPTSFIEVQGEGLNRLSQAFGDYAKKHISNLEADKLEKYKAAPFRAPMVIILINTPKQHVKVPETEQIMSSAAAAQNILLALNSLGYAGIWRTGTFALNKNICKYLELNSDQQVLGYLYVGTPEGAAKKIPNLDPKDYVTKWK
jgi:nitroreductase